MTSDPPTGELPLIDARGHRGFVERLILGPTERIDQNSRWHQRVPGPQTPGMVSTITLLFGLWVAMSPFLWHESGTTFWSIARWNEILVGLAIAALGFARLARPLRLLTASTLGGLFGGWLLLSPFLFDYGLGTGTTPATINDILVGLTVIAVTVLGHSDTREALTTT
ncbi:Conserved putative membrane protein [Rhodococcus opacus]|uniref:Conserved putative membrane protein n=1 Tax=Rhodococcus opacus TaxID=37919 RepID=A0A1B1K7Q4_RHOOP|nr:SPW repeat protein [Rhodococcus opacus]ANS28655.1 Conserved putative membrane protein [Rhodococcus opacus]